MGIMVLACWCGHSLSGMGRIVDQQLLSRSNVFLLLNVFQITWLGGQMKDSGLMQEIVSSVRSRLSQKWSMALLPAIIGFLPMPGGAIFSAPMVDGCDQPNRVDPQLKASINYWFRHIWEYWWPLYPGVLLAIKLTGLPMEKLIVLHLPLSLLAILAGYLFLLRRIPEDKLENKMSRVSFRQLFTQLLPLELGLFSLVFINSFLPRLAKYSPFLPIILAVMVTQILLQYQRPLGFTSWRKNICSMQTTALALLVMLIMIYGAFINAALPDGTPLMEKMRSEMGESGIPILFMIILIPFICGFTIGLAVGYVGASFPIVLSLLGSNPAPSELMATSLLAYAAGYIGLLLCPVHICLVVSCQYFQRGIAGSLKLIFYPCLMVMAGAMGIYFILI